MVWVTALGSASMALVTPKMLPVMTLMRANASTAAKAPPARSFAQLPPMATANRMCRLLMTAQPMFSIVVPTVMTAAMSLPPICTSLPRLIIRPAAGVSPSTVSRTCKDSPSISRETKERVRRIMAQLGYEPNFEAEPVEAFSKTIGIILPSSQRDVYENAFHLEIIRGIGQFCNQRRYVNTVITGQDDAEVLDAIQSMVANAQADGFILLYSKKDCPVAAYLRNEGLLHVIVGKAAQSANQTIYIDNDNALAGEEAADYLYEMGHRRIAYFGVSNAMLFSAERKRGYQMSLLKHGITPREEDCVEVNTLNDAYEEALKALLTAPNHPTAMLVSDDILAVVLEQFCGKLGLRIPKDLSIVSFNNSLFSRITSPQLTTVDVNPYQLGMEAASQTINHIENPNLLATKIIVPHKLIPRESCCPPEEQL